MRIYRYERCWILSFPAIGKWKIEIVYAPRGYKIPEHSHDQQDIELIPLFCQNIRFHRREQGYLLGESFWATWKHIGKRFSLRAGDTHWFEVSNFPFIFLNIEKWHTKPTSAAIDLHLTVKKEAMIYGR